MNVKEMKQILDKLPEDMPVFIDMDTGQLNSVDGLHVARVRSDQYDDRWPDKIVDWAYKIKGHTRPVLTIFP